jgi:hypothetical protein
MSSVIIPYCIFRKENFVTIRPSIKDSNGEFVCESLDDDWKLSYKFYAVNPMLRPIPEGMNLYFAKISPEDGSVKNFQIVYNPYSFQEKGVYFISYETQVPNTKPLYIKKTPNGVDFSEKKIIDDILISPVYVMQKSLFPDKEFKFMCTNGRCIPYSTRTDLFDIKKGEPKSLLECITNCSQLIPIEEGGGKPYNMNTLLKKLDKKHLTVGQKIKRGFKKIPSWTFLLIFCFLIISLSLILYFSFKKSQ